jgi:hypothetical protein
MSTIKDEDVERVAERAWIEIEFFKYPAFCPRKDAKEIARWHLEAVEKLTAENERFKNFVELVREFINVCVCECGGNMSATDLVIYLRELDNALTSNQPAADDSTKQEGK